MTQNNDTESKEEQTGEGRVGGRKGGASICSTSPAAVLQPDSGSYPCFTPAQSHARESNSSATMEVNLVHHINLYAYDAAMPLTIVAG